MKCHTCIQLCYVHALLLGHHAHFVVLAVVVVVVVVAAATAAVVVELVVVVGQSRLPREGLYGALSARALDRQLFLRQLLPPALVLVEGGEVVADDGDGQRDHEDAADGAARADHLAQSGRGTDVTVADLQRRR